MYGYNEIFELVFNNLKRFIFPEEWLAVDLEMSKQELLSLMMVDRHGEITMSQIADFINIPMSTATGIIDRLVKKGYVVRDRDESDRRIVVIKLTEKGKSLSDEMKGRISSYIKKAYDALTDEERGQLFKIFNKIMSAIQEDDRELALEDNAGSAIKKIEID